MDYLLADEASLLRYLEWMFEDNAVDFNSVKNYISSVITSQKLVGRSPYYNTLVNLAVSSYMNLDMEQNALKKPELSKERRALPRDFARSIHRDAVNNAS